jgi:pimeloyl-ACP methyl ester carboxylesterase
MDFIKNLVFRHSAVAGRFILPIVLVIVSSCSNDDSPSNEEEKVLVSSEFVYAATAQQIKLLAQISGLGVDENEFLHDVDIYKVTYNTTYKGTTLHASGLISLPKTTLEVGMLSYQHGTLTNRAEAPSNFSTSNPNTLLYAAMASAGFIGVIPDYLGFGASSSMLHPYYIEEATASAVIDMLKAAGELAEEKNVQFNEKLFLAGYSEGGYATMAAHKSIEENGLDGFNLIASFPGAGGYDVKGIQEHIFSLQEYDDPHYLAYLARAYQLHYDENTLLTDLFNEPYAGRIPSLLDGQKGFDAINAQLTPDISELIQANVLTNIDTDTKYDYLTDAFEENSLTDWAPTISMYMYHGTSDTTVPYQNSVDSYNAFITNGASSNVVTLTPLTGTHSTTITPYIIDFIPKLLTLK